MRECRGEQIAESKAEFLAMLGTPRTVQERCKKNARPKPKYLDATCTFDIETTNTDTDGFAYSFQTCIGGAVVVPRYFEDWAEIIEALVDKWSITERKRLVIFVHNLGYEYTYLIQMLCDRWGDCKALYTKSRKPLYLMFDNGIEFRDSLKLFQKSLARATEGCKHEKLKGDLDYSVYRTADTPLDDTEFAYCVNDVLGLWEAIERLKAERKYNAATLPMTNTALVIKEVNKHLTGDSRTLQKMQALELNREQMEIAYKAMAGGDTHGTRWRAGQTYRNCNSYDFKSAHPSQQLLWKFPEGHPMMLPQGQSQTVMDNIIASGMGWIAEIAIKGLQIRPECPDPVISVSKCAGLKCDDENKDNGRVLQADETLLYCDSNDWQRIKEAYTFERVVMHRGFCFRLGYLPDSFRMAIFDKFKIKETMKGSPDYAFSKICVNTIFGACAQKTIRDEYTAEIGDSIDFERMSWEVNLEKKTPAEIQKSQKGKFPFLWGLWTASLTRLKLWQLLKIVGWEKVIYWDTDSCKFEGAKVPASNSIIKRSRPSVRSVGWWSRNPTGRKSI